MPKINNFDRGNDVFMLWIIQIFWSYNRLDVAKIRIYCEFECLAMSSISVHNFLYCQ